MPIFYPVTAEWSHLNTSLALFFYNHFPSVEMKVVKFTKQYFSYVIKALALQTQMAISRILQAPRRIVRQPGRYPAAE